MKTSCLLIPLCSMFCASGLSQEPAPPAATTPKVITKESTIYVPFEKLEEVFEGQEQGVFLPYREFLEMWNKLNVPEKLKKTEPPVDGILAGANYAGSVSGDVAEFRAKLSFEALKDGWSSLKLGGELALADVKTTALLNAVDGGHEVIFQNKGAYTLDATVHGRVVRDKGRATLALKLPRTAVSQFELTVPEKGLEFEVKPAAAFSAVEQGNGTKLAVYFGASQEVTVSWTKKGGETALPALLFADVAADLRVGHGAVRVDAAVNFRILRAGVGELGFAVPGGFQVLAVEGQNIKEWVTLPGATPADLQTISVKLHTPAKDAYVLRLRLEAPVGILPQTVKLPEIKVAGVERQSGSVNVSSDGELIVEPSGLAGLTQQAVAAGKDGAPPAGLVASYRYLRLPYAGALAITEAKPQIEVATRTSLIVGTDVLKLDAAVTYTVKKAGVFSVQIELPPGFADAEIVGKAAEASRAVVDGKTVLTASFKQRQTGTFGFRIAGEMPRAKADDALTVPVIRPLGVERHDAKAGIGVHVSLKANTTDKADFIEEDIGNLDGVTVADARAPLTLGFRYRTQGNKVVAPATIAFELRKPRVSAEVLGLVDVRETLTRHEWHVHYTVEFAGVSEFTIEVPKAIADDLKIEGAQIRERIKAGAKGADGQPDGATEWRVVTQDKVLGKYHLVLTHDAARGEQKPGEVVPVTLHEIKATGVFRETGQIAVVKVGNLELTSTDAKGLETIDPKELRPALQRDGIFLAYKYSQHPVALSLGVSKNSFLDVPQAVVTYAVLTSVIAEDQAETTEVVYWVKNNSQQFFSVQLPTRGGKAARLLSDAFVDGEPQQPSRRPAKNEVLIRLPVKGGNTGEFAIRFVYELPSPKPGEKLGWRGEFDVQPPGVADVKVLQTKWTVFLPQDHRYVGFGGAMRESISRVGSERWPRILWRIVARLGPGETGIGRIARSEPGVVPEPTKPGFNTQLRTEGQKFELRRMEAPAAITVGYRGKTYSFLLQAFAALITFGIGVVCLRKSPRERWAYFIAVGIGALIVSGAVHPRTAGVWQAAFGGVMAAGFVWAALGCWRDCREWRERRERRIAAMVYGPAPAASAPKPAGTDNQPPAGA